MSWLTVTGAALADLPPDASTSNAPRSASAPMAPTLTTSYSILNRFLKPRSFGMRMWSGVWPPSNQGGIEPPARAFWPFVPRPAVLPLPAAMPRPTRVRGWREPSAGWRSWSFMPCLRCRAPVPSAISSTVTRNRTWRTMPRVAGLSVITLVLPIPCRPRARTVARLRAM